MITAEMRATLDASKARRDADEAKRLATRKSILGGKVILDGNGHAVEFPGNEARVSRGGHTECGRCDCLVIALAVLEVVEGKPAIATYCREGHLIERWVFGSEEARMRAWAD